MEKNSELKRLEEIDLVIQRMAREFGLDFFQQEFDVIPEQKMLEIMAYGLPVNFSHWSFGRDYERYRTEREYGIGVPYEVVLNSDPCRAYLMQTNPFPVQAMVMAHVYAHNDFMKYNVHFSKTRRDMIPSASGAAERFRQYEEDWGLAEVEKVIDAGLSIRWNIEPHPFIREEGEEEQFKRLAKPQKTPEISSGFDDLLFPKKLPKKNRRELKKRTPLEPTGDLLLYIIEHSPKPLDDWEQDVLSVIRQQSLYLAPQLRTKIMNEGWATYWHQKIMQKLFREGHLTPEEHGYYNTYNARVLARIPKRINPYLIGLKIFEDIENRWNKGRFGRDWEECAGKEEFEKWDKKLGLGRHKIFDVRRTYTDWFFVEQFLTAELVDDLDLYVYQREENPEESTDIVSGRDWKEIKKFLVSATRSGMMLPLIKLENGDHKGRRELYLKHYFEGLLLDPEYRIKTMEHIFYLWNRPVNLETVASLDQNGKSRKYQKVIYTFNGQEHTAVRGDFVDIEKEKIIS